MPGTSCADTLNGEPGGLRTILVEFLNRRRVAISAITYIALIGSDLLMGVRPHDILNWHDPFTVVGTLSVLTGLLLRSWAAGFLKKQRELTRIGPYRLVRHPLYLGSFLMMFGFCALIGSAKNVWFICGPILLLYLLKIHREERGLAAHFGPPWLEYTRQTPRFFPRSWRTSVRTGWMLSLWLRSREYRAVLTTLLGFAALKVWQVW